MHEQAKFRSGRKLMGFCKEKTQFFGFFATCPEFSVSDSFATPNFDGVSRFTPINRPAVILQCSEIKVLGAIRVFFGAFSWIFGIFRKFLQSEKTSFSKSRVLIEEKMVFADFFLRPVGKKFKLRILRISRGTPGKLTAEFPVF